MENPGDPVWDIRQGSSASTVLLCQGKDTRSVLSRLKLKLMMPYLHSTIYTVGIGLCPILMCSEVWSEILSKWYGSATMSLCTPWLFALVHCDCSFSEVEFWLF